MEDNFTDKFWNSVNELNRSYFQEDNNYWTIYIETLAIEKKLIRADLISSKRMNLITKMLLNAPFS